MATGSGSGKGGMCPGLIWAVLWFILIFVCMLLAWVVVFFYVLILPLCACLPFVKSICDPLLQIVQLPLTCAENMMAMKPPCG